MDIQKINVQQAAELVKNGAVLIDIRSDDEYSRKHISGAKCIPCGEMTADKLPKDKAIIFHAYRACGRNRTHKHFLNVGAIAVLFIY